MAAMHILHPFGASIVHVLKNELGRCNIPMNARYDKRYSMWLNMNMQDQTGLWLCLNSAACTQISNNKVSISTTMQ